MSTELPTIYQQYIAISRYARFIDELGRRETWSETVDRYITHFKKYTDNNKKIPWDELRNGILNLEVMPSMRAMMTAGRAAERDNMSIYNCSFLPIDNPKAFDELLYILCCGTGVGFSVETQFTNKLPEVPDELHETDTTIVFRDSKIGWATGFREFISLLYSGKVAKYDTSKIRKAGERLKVFGGRASGADPLIDLLEFTKKIFQKAKGRKLTTIECHDIVCKIADIVVVGGVRRCLPYNTSIQTTTGFKPIQDIALGDFVVTGGNSYRVLEQVYSGKQKTLTFKHRFGILECTENHEVAVFDSIGNYNFKPAKDIRVGDCLVWDTAGVDGTRQTLPGKLSEEAHFNEKSYNIPTHLNDDLAWLIGYIHGDGSIQPKGIEISGNIEDQKPLKKAERIFKEQFGVSGVVAPDFKEGKGCRLRINSVRLSEWFSKYIKTPHTDIQIPDFIVKSTRSNRGAYLAGLFDADGRIGKDFQIDQCTSVYPKFTKQLVSLLSTLGIAAKVYFKNQDVRRDNGVDCQDYYTIRVVGNLNRINWKNMSGQFSSKKHQRINECLFHSPIDFAWSSDMTMQACVGHRNRSSTTRTINTAERIYQPVEVMEIIQSSESIDTYDIEVETVHQFTTNGIVVHNSALISLSDLNDDHLRNAKSGQWWLTDGHRQLANNSAVYEAKPDMDTFMREWFALYNSKSGERGIFSRQAARVVVAKNGRRDPDHVWGVNPCSEIILRPYEVCNLSEVIVRAEDTQETLSRKVRLATILGTLQATHTNFRYVNKKWKNNCEEEALLGVSLTGIMDNVLTNGSRPEDIQHGNLQRLLETLKNEAIATNKEFAKILGINQAAAITCTKPSGTISQLVDSASGIHPRYAKYYIRRVRQDKKDPLSEFMMSHGYQAENDFYGDSRWVFSFPQKAPEGSVVTSEITAIQQLELWKIYQEHWCEHKPSITVYVGEDEWMEVGAWVYKNINCISGVSFLPRDTGSYRQAPYEEITKEQYDAMVGAIPKNIDWTQFRELTDNTEGTQQLACSAAGGCEI